MDIESLLREIKQRTKLVNTPGIAEQESSNSEPISSAEFEKKKNISSDFLSQGADGDSIRARADVLIIVALQNPEADQVKKVLEGSWYTESREGITYNVVRLKLEDRHLNVVLAVQTNMGMVPAAILATKAIRVWRPSIVAMLGICAGVEGRTNLGDVVVGKQLLDYGSGKFINGELTPDYSPVLLDSELSSQIQELASSKTLCADIRGSWPTDSGKPDTDLKIHLGIMGSGAAVVQDPSVIDKVKQHARTLTAIDMEAYAVARSAADAFGGPVPCVIAKGVQDYADESKNDDFREFSAYASSRFFLEYLKEYAAYIRPPGATLLPASARAT